MKQYEIIRQHDLKDCGVCSLLSIIKHYGGFISLEKLRIDTHTSLEGTSAYHILEAAKKYGFDAYGMQLDNLNSLNNLILPAIAHVVVNNLQHFVVIYKISKNKIEIMDPAKGKVKLKLADFMNIWTNNILLFYPKYSLPKSNPKNFFKTFFVQILKKERRTILHIILTTIAFTGITIFTSFYFKIGMSLISENNEYSTLLYISISFIALYLIKIAVYYQKNYFKTILNKNVDGYLYYSFINRLFLLPNYFIKNRTTGEIVLRLSELSNFKMFFTEVITVIFIDLILSISVGIILFNMNHILFLILCFFIIIYFLYGIISGKILYKQALNTNEKEVDFQSQVVENLDTMITLKNLNVLEKATKKLETKLFKFLKKTFHLNKAILNNNTFSYALEEILNFLIITIGLREVMEKNISFIDLVTFESLLSYFIEPFKNIIHLIPNYNFIKVSLEKITDFYNLELENKNEGLNEFKTGDISVENFNYSYNKFDPILNNINIFIKENSCVLIKGKSGCGKSTLCQAISRLIDVEKSNIKIGNININDYSLETIRKNITYVGQKESLIQETIRNNILLYREIDERLFNQVTNICKIEEIVAKKPLRYETYLLKDSLNLSGGEKQRIILARALLNNSKILILDEALSEVNEDMEVDIINNIQNQFKEKTIIYVSHKNHDQYFDTIIDFEEQK